MNRARVRLYAITSLLAVCSITLAEWDLEWRTVDGGGVMRSTSGSFELSGTIGQPDAGWSEGQTLSLTGGFWFEHAPGDCGLDGAVNIQDAAGFEGCADGPNSPDVPSSCTCLDFDGDGDVDLRDAAAFQSSFTVP